MKKTETVTRRTNRYKVKDQRQSHVVEPPFDTTTLRSEIEPWLAALLQSEHLSLLLGNGISSAAHTLATGNPGLEMSLIPFKTYRAQIETGATESASKSLRGNPNFEDQIRVCNELIQGLRVYVLGKIAKASEIGNKINALEMELEQRMKTLANNILECESNILYSDNAEQAAKYLVNFLVSFASRSATRERLHIFTTNYDRIIEYGAELAGIRLIDRFVGTVNPVFRSSRLAVDMHYNPPGIRGEPRYLEGVVHYSKLHGSLDWSANGGEIKRFALPYGETDIAPFVREGCERMLIYPNAVKDRETSEYPYVELFRDFASAICRPNSTLFVYGYGFGDSHINRVIADMMTIPSTHLVIISFDDVGNRVKKFYKSVRRPAQISLLLGNHFGELKSLVDHYLPTPSVDRTTIKMADLIRSRTIETQTKMPQE